MCLYAPDVTVGPDGRYYLYYVLDKEKLQVEVLTNLDQVQPAGAVIIVSYPRIENATGLPARVWAITE